MVEGLARFADHFKKFTDQYVLIGGAACHLAMQAPPRLSASRRIWISCRAWSRWPEPSSSRSGVLSTTASINSHSAPLDAS